ncbi:hypothetical protein NLJ89_g8320 [Agrocybe chaxingu]|uniref:Uncharacterized protein n=1 Tax=Agrocybe chaxingu TaxID=84603 RepID=A0A9W8MQW3_9AGAR|nr:hypothetical protein NLJ89_g8320 [Agrocybe chaxingu]
MTQTSSTPSPRPKWFVSPVANAGLTRFAGHPSVASVGLASTHVAALSQPHRQPTPVAAGSRSLQVRFAISAEADAPNANSGSNDPPKDGADDAGDTDNGSDDDGEPILVQAVSSTQLPQLPFYIKTYSIPAPKSFEPPPGLGEKKFYIITRGQGVGIFSNWKMEVAPRIKSVANTVFELHLNWREASAVYELAYKEGTIEVVPVDDGPFDNPIQTAWVARGPSRRRYCNMPSLKPYNTDIPHPDCLVPPAFKSSKYYIVIQGAEIGIFATWHQTAVRTLPFRPHESELFASWDAALIKYRSIHEAGQFAVRPSVAAGMDQEVPDLVDKRLLARLGALHV